MPVIPTFDVNVAVPSPAGPPRIDPTAFEAPAAALAQGGAQVSSQLNEFAQRYAEARRSADATNLVSQGVQQLGDARFKWSKVADSTAAYAGYQQDAATIKQKLLANVSDPLVQSYVTRSLDPEIVSGALATHDAAFGLESSARRGDLDTNLLTFRQAIAAAPNDLAAAHNRDLATQAIEGARAAGWIKPEEAAQLHIQFGSEVASDQAKRMILANPSQAAAILGDPVKAQAAFPGLTPNMADALAAHAETRAYRMEARQREAETLARADLGQTIQDLSYAYLKGVTDTPIPEAQIKAAYGADHGGRIIAGLKVDQQAGPAIASLEFASPDQQLAILTALKTPGAFSTNGMKFVNGKIVAPDGAGGTTPAIEPPEALRERARALSAVQGFLDQQHVADAKDLQQQHVADAKDLQQQLGGLKEQYLQGVTSAPVPENQIRKLLPPDQADRIVQSFQTLKQGGELLASMQGASPEQQRAAIEAMATPGTLSGNRLRVEHGQIVPPPAGSVTQPATETPEDEDTRNRLLERIIKVTQQNSKALIADPAGYAAQQPDVAAKLATVDPSKPDSLAAGYGSLLAMQQHLGVPPDSQAILTNGQAAAIAKDWTESDPATVDVGAKIDALRQQTGDYFPKAFADIQRVGKLDPRWNIVASMTEPSQQAGRAELIRMLQATAGPGGAKKLEESIPQTARQTIDKNLDDEIAHFKDSVSIPGEPPNLDLVNGVQEAVRNLARYKVLQGADPLTALHAAADQVVNDKYDFDGYLRAPKGQMAQAQALTRQVQFDLTAADVKPPANSDPTLTPEQNAQVWVTAAQRNGRWVTNRNDTGAVLMVPTRDGAFMPLVKRNGMPVQVYWSDLGAAVHDVPAQLGGADPTEDEQSPLMNMRLPTGPDLSHVTNRPVGAAVRDWWRGAPSTNP